MKTRLLLFALLMLGGTAFAQEPQTTMRQPRTPAPDTISKDTLKEINETLKRIEEKIDKATDQHDSIGYVELTTINLRQYKDMESSVISKAEFDTLKDEERYVTKETVRGGKKGEKADVYHRKAWTQMKEIDLKEVTIEIRNSAIVSLFVKAEENGRLKVFSNSQTFIELSEINANRCDELQGSDHYYLKVCDFLLYFGSRVLPDDCSITLTTPNEKKKITIGSGINNVFQARIYTDLLGLVGDESNGLVQSEVSFKSNLHSRNLPDSPVYLFHYVYADAGIYRFDSKFRTVDASDLSVFDSTATDSVTYDYMDLYQQSFISSTLKLNLIEWYVNRSYSSFSVNAIAGLNAARLQDSLTLPVRRVNMPYFGGEVLFHAKPFDNFGLIASYSLRRLYFFGLQDKTPEVGSPKPTYTVSMEMYWNPMGKEANRIFARFRYTDMFGPSLPFSQFQVGYAVNLSEWAKSKD